jgi:aspartyl-tRNA(Asn)/glutamyl-tRNA(Gln) amidotransferase subunit C
VAKVSAETVDHIAGLAHLSLTEEERNTFARQLEAILDYAESIQALDIADVPPMSHPHADGSLRGDERQPSLDAKTVLAEAPDPAERLFRVPRVIGG